jgi:hypothetical protein
MVSLLDAVRWTGRASALLFVAALAVPALRRRTVRCGADLFLLFVVAHTVHYAVVASYAIAVPNAALFPGDRDLAAVGGWPTVFGLITTFYVPALLGLAARRAGGASRPWLRNADRASTLFIGFMFVATYVPLLERSMAYAFPMAMVLAGLLLYVQKAWCAPALSRDDLRT